jgi:hypothetical protein
MSVNYKQNLKRAWLLTEAEMQEAPQWDDDWEEWEFPPSSTNTKKTMISRGKIVDKFKIGDLDVVLFHKLRPNNEPWGLAAIIFGKNERVVGEFEFAYKSTDPKFDAPGTKNLVKLQVVSASVGSSYKGKGISTKIYQEILDKHTDILISDASLTGRGLKKGSFQLWEKLSKKYNPYVLKIGKRSRILPVQSFSKVDHMGDKINMQKIRLVLSKEAL